MNRLPIWRLTGGLPASRDSESATVLEQTFKLYGAIQELIEEYNKFATKVNEDIEAHESKYESDWETFQTSFRQEFQDFIDVVDLKIETMEQVIFKDAQEYLQTELKSEMKTMLNTEIKLIEEYDSTNESLNVKVGAL